MAIKNIEDLIEGKRKIDLTGPDGNAFRLLGIAKNLSIDLELKFEKIRKEMTSGNYENLIKVFDDYFGDYVDLYR